MFLQGYMSTDENLNAFSLPSPKPEFTNADRPLIFSDLKWCKHHHHPHPIKIFYVSSHQEVHIMSLPWIK